MAMRKKWLRWLLVVLWMIVIFMFSSQNGEQSSNNNRFIVEILKHIGINLDALLGSMDNYIIRKLAHMTEYFVLFNLLFNAINEGFKFKKDLILSLLLTFIYAGSDEYHQSFIPGRGPSFKDVMIDTGGGAIGLIYRSIRMYIKR